MAQYQCRIDLGPDLTFKDGQVYFFGMQSGNPVNIGTHDLDTPNFNANIDSSAFEYMYAIVMVQKYTKNGLTANIGNRRIPLLTIFRASETNLNFGLRETIASSMCFARFSSVQANGLLHLNAGDREIGIMLGMRNNFISSSGEISNVIRTSPNHKETNSYPMFNYLANVLYYCVTDTATYDSFLEYCGEAESTLEALLYMNAHPWNNTQEIYDLCADKDQMYTPSLPDMYTPEQLDTWSPVPNQWTLTIKVHNSGARNFLISGPGYLDFDENDRIWISNNVTQGSPNSSAFCVVLEPDGSPADFSPVFGGGLLGGGFGCVANPARDKVILGNYGWGPKQYNPQNGGISVISSDGRAISPPDGYNEGTRRIQGLMYDRDGNLWISSWGTQAPMAPSDLTIYDFKDSPSAVVVYLNFDGSRAPESDEILRYEFDNPSPYNCTFDVAFDSKGNAFVANAGGSYKQDGVTVKIPSSIYKLRINRDNPDKPCLECLAKWEFDTYEALRQITVNAHDEVYVAVVKAGCVMKFDNNLSQCLKRFDNNIGSPWGVMFDKEGGMYAANFFAVHEEPPRMGEQDARGTFGITLVVNDDESTARIFTLPTGGLPVKLANGFDIYGSDGPPCYQPLSRLTGSVIDRVGNLIAINNWKPSAYIDFSENPGGDGLVFFISAAPPPQNA